MTPEITDLVTMGGSAIVGKGLHLASAVIRELSNARREAWSMGEKSMERAASVNGGVWVRRAIYALVAFSFVSIIVAGFMRVPVIIENEVTKGFLFWQRTAMEYIAVDGVPFLAVNKTAFLALVSFYLGAKA
tara:strand:+ start:395 stop:790 length:396 start_codon:yes stop_codon:yes gene_type:complete